MSQTGTSTKQQKHDATRVDMKLEVDIIPVSDVERSKQFYQSLGWRLDSDVAPANNIRIVQFTPPGSGCSVTFGKGLTAAAPGTAVGGLIVSDIVAAHDELVGRGIAASEVWHGRRSPRRHGSAAPTPSARATGRSPLLTIPTAIRG
jgi:catechol 2,3-dioxygenase-like lactoylglutathione lyase family enzyme